MGSYWGKWLFCFLLLSLWAGCTYGQTNCLCAEKVKQQGLFIKLKSEGAFAEANKICDQLINAQSPGCKALGYNLKFTLLFRENKLDECLKVLKAERAILAQNKCSEENYLYNYSYQGNYHFVRNEFSDAMKYYTRAVLIGETVKDSTILARCLGNIAAIFTRQEQYDKALVYNRKTILLVDGIQDSVVRGNVLTNLASAYSDYYDVYHKVSFLDSAVIFSEKAIRIFDKLFFIDGLVTAYSIRAGIYTHKKQFKTAIQSADTVRKYARNGLHDRQLHVSSMYKSRSLWELKQYQEARLYADSCLIYAKSFGNIDMIRLAMVEIYKTAKAMGDYETALRVREESIAIKDSILNLENLARTTELEQKYNKERNERTIGELTQEKKIYALQNRLLLGGILLAVLVILVVVFFMRQLNLKKKQQILETEQRLNRARMNPHFFFNALMSLQHAAIKEQDGKKIAAAIASFASLMRQTLEMTYKEYVTLEEETDYLNKYLALQQSRSSTPFTYSIKTDAGLDPSDVILPGMMLQPFLENAIEHGFNQISYPGQLSISFEAAPNQLVILVGDNGAGLKPNEKTTQEHISRAMQIVQDRLFILRKRTKKTASYEIHAGENGTGTLVKIILPLLHTHENTDY